MVFDELTQPNKDDLLCYLVNGLNNLRALGFRIEAAYTMQEKIAIGQAAGDLKLSLLGTLDQTGFLDWYASQDKTNMITWVAPFKQEVDNG